MKNPTHYSVFVHLPPAGGLPGLATHVIERESEDELRVDESGALHVFDMLGETFIYAPGSWTSVKVRPEGGTDD